MFKIKKILGMMNLLSLTTFFFILPAPSVPDQRDIVCATDVIVQSGELLSTLANRFYGDAAAYQPIIEATNTKAALDDSYARIESANALRVGWKLCVPGPLISQTRPEETATTAPTSSLLPFIETAVQSHPLSIEQMRQRDYPGSALVIEESLTPGNNYRRQLVSYRSDDLKIQALMTIPTAEQPATGWPVILFNHGYISPEGYRATDYYVDYVDIFARNGYIVFQPDYRGHGDSEGEATGLYMTSDYVTDVLNALASIKAHPAADPERIGMWGHSMGGYITLRAMVATDEIKAGVIWAGVVASYPDMVTWWDIRRSPALAQPRQWRDVIVATYGTWEDNPAFWAAISANSYLADVSGPIQLHHSPSDAVVPVAFSETLTAQLQAAGRPVDYYIYEGDDHNLSLNFITAMNRSVAFFDTHVK